MKTELPLKIATSNAIPTAIMARQILLHCTRSLFEYSRIFHFEILQNFISLENDQMNELGFRKSRNGFTSGFTSGPGTVPI